MTRKPAAAAAAASAKSFSVSGISGWQISEKGSQQREG